MGPLGSVPSVTTQLCARCALWMLPFGERAVCEFPIISAEANKQHTTSWSFESFEGCCDDVGRVNIVYGRCYSYTAPHTHTETPFIVARMPVPAAIRQKPTLTTHFPPCARDQAAIRHILSTAERANGHEIRLLGRPTRNSVCLGPVSGT